MKEHLELMGHKVTDVVTGFKGCVQAGVQPEANEKGEIADARWFDTKRLMQTSNEPVMEVPSFETVPGPADKPGAATLAVPR